MNEDRLIDQGLTFAERQVLDLLWQALEAYYRLPVESASEPISFADTITEADTLIKRRAALRLYHGKRQEMGEQKPRAQSRVAEKGDLKAALVRDFGEEVIATAARQDAPEAKPTAEAVQDVVQISTAEKTVRLVDGEWVDAQTLHRPQNASAAFPVWEGQEVRAEIHDSDGKATIWNPKGGKLVSATVELPLKLAPPAKPPTYTLSRIDYCSGDRNEEVIETGSSLKRLVTRGSAEQSDGDIFDFVIRDGDGAEVWWRKSAHGGLKINPLEAGWLADLLGRFNLSEAEIRGGIADWLKQHEGVE